MGIFICLIFCTVIAIIGYQLAQRHLSKPSENLDIQEDEEKHEIIYCEVVGTHYRTSDEIKRATLLVPGETLLLEKELDNSYDPDAIRVLTIDNIFIGYISAQKSMAIKALMYCHPNYEVTVNINIPGDLAPFIHMIIKY